MIYNLYTDGSHSVELNIAGMGGILLDAEQREVFTFSEPITNHMAYHELHAMEHGLKKALEAGVKHIVCHTDSIRNAHSLDKKELKEDHSENTSLFNNVIRLSQQFESISFKYIPRNENKKADHLAGKHLIDAMKEKSRVDIFQARKPNANYFKCDNLFATEQFISKDKYLAQKSSISVYYLFEIGHTIDSSFVDIYRVDKKESITYEKIKTHTFTDNLWKEFLNQIKETLDNSPDKNVALLLSKNTDVEQMLRGMKVVSKKLEPSFEELAISMARMDSVYLESGGLAYDAIFPPAVKKNESERKNFYLHAMKTLGEDYTIGQDSEIENYFELPAMKKERVDEIQKKYFGEFMKMVIAQKEAIDFKQVKQDLIGQGIKFKY
jgi:ribonuclease HI